jgi:hypothetical protein
VAEKPYLALIVPSTQTMGAPGLPPGHAPGGPSQAPGLPPGQMPPSVMPPIIEVPPEIPDLPEDPNAKLILVWDGEWRWAVLSGNTISQPIAPTPAPKR